MMRNRTGSFVIAGAGALAIALAANGEPTKVVSSFGPVNQDVTFSQIKADRLAVKAERARAHAALLASRYDLKKTGGEVLMSGGKAVPAGPTAPHQDVPPPLPVGRAVGIGATWP